VKLHSELNLERIKFGEFLLPRSWEISSVYV